MSELRTQPTTSASKASDCMPCSHEATSNIEGTVATDKQNPSGGGTAKSIAHEQTAPTAQPQNAEPQAQEHPEATGTPSVLPVRPAQEFDAETKQLRELLLGQEIAQLEDLRKYISCTRFDAQQVGDVLAEAVRLRSTKDQSLTLALAPLVDTSLKKSMRLHRTEFVNELFPLMGPAIRKSISETFRSMLGSFSESVEMAVSWKGLRWRLEALKTGKSFSEVVMLHTIEYHVEQAFFIHSETGLVLAHLANEGIGGQNADAVSAMLTAIQQFASDCFANDASEGGTLDTINLGDLSVYIEKAPLAYMACAVRGTPPPGFRQKMRSNLEMMLVEYHEYLVNFDGDDSHFTTAVRYLDDCMLSKFKEDKKLIPTWAKLFITILLLGAFGFGGYKAYLYHKEKELNAALEAQKNTALDLLRRQEGIMVLDNPTGPPPWDVILLRDALSPYPEELLQEHSLDSSLFNIKSIPIVSYSPDIILERAKRELNPPSTVKLQLSNDGTLTMQGTASIDWIADSIEKARWLPGVSAVDAHNVHDPRSKEISILIAKIEDTSIEFMIGKDIPVPADAQKLEEIVDTLVDLEARAARMGFTVQLAIYGHTDGTGGEKRNYELSSERARTVAAKLYKRGSTMPLSVHGLGAMSHADTSSDTPNQSQRRLEMRVQLTRIAKPVDTELFKN